MSWQRPYSGTSRMAHPILDRLSRGRRFPMIVGGVDEAGRGSIAGPLVVAGVSIDPSAAKELREMGVKDSKLLSVEEREEMYGRILKLSRRVHSVPIKPVEIDEYVCRGRKYRRLNFLEAIHMAKVIDRLGAEEVFVDAPDTNPRRFTRELQGLMLSKPRIVAEHKADVRYVVVSAASIIAKVERDREIVRLRGEYGNFGSGYPSDSRTISFLRAWVEREGSPPAFTRRSWKTWNRILSTTIFQ